MPGLGYAAFALTMTVGRITGDRIVQRHGGSNVIVFGGLCAALGFAFAALVPVLANRTARLRPGRRRLLQRRARAVHQRRAARPSCRRHVAVPAITTLGYAGILAGPALIGLVAHAASLSVAFLMLAIMLLGVAAGGRLRII